MVKTIIRILIVILPILISGWYMYTTEFDPYDDAFNYSYTPEEKTAVIKDSLFAFEERVRFKENKIPKMNQKIAFGYVSDEDIVVDGRNFFLNKALI